MADVALNLGDGQESRLKDIYTCITNSDVFLYFQSVFKSIDTNEDGFINYAELKEFLDNNEHTNIPEKVVKCVYRRYDLNRDEKLDFYEFLEMVTDPDFNNAFENVTDRILKFVVAPSRSQRGQRLKLQRTVTATGAYEKESRCKANVLGMAIITVFQIIVYYSNKSYLTEDDDKGPLREFLHYDPCRKFEIYRYVSHILIHSSDMHLYGNLVVQILIGIPLEMVHSWRVMLIYFSGAIGGCVTHSVFRRTAGLVGASGAVYSFYTAHIAAVIMNWREMSHPAVHLLLFGVIVSIDGIYVAIYEQYSNISYTSHGGGAVIGLLLGIVVLRNLRETKRENILWHVCCVTLGLLVLIFVLLDICLPVKDIDCDFVELQLSKFVKEINGTMINNSTSNIGS